MRSLFRDGAFEAVSGNLILHHLDAGLAGREVARVLKEGGRAVFTENSARSGVLMFARRSLCGRFGIPKWSTPDEYPLRGRELALLSAPFALSRLEHPRFDWFFLLDAKLFGFRNLRASRILSFLDRATVRVAPFMRKLAYYQVVILDR
jgi:SAM-dependent methyltransferase